MGNKICFLLIYLSGDLGTREVYVTFPGFVFDKCVLIHCKATVKHSEVVL